MGGYVSAKKERKLLRKALYAIADTLPLEKIAKYYRKKNWCWLDVSVDEDAIIDAVVRHIDAVVDEKLERINSGGISVFKACGTIGITFSVYRKPHKIWYAQIHDELSQLEEVINYFDYIAEE